MNTCATCKHFQVVNHRGPVLLTICDIAEIDSYRDEEQTCEEWEAKNIIPRGSNALCEVVEWMKIRNEFREAKDED